MRTVKEPIEQKSIRVISSPGPRVTSTALLVVIATTLLIVLAVIGVAIYACGIR